MTEIETTTFGGSPQEADGLLALVLAGTKTGTCWAAEWGVRNHVGKRVVLCDSSGKARAILETVSLARRRFNDIDASWAQVEGEGDLSLDHWRRTHAEFFRREGTFSDDMELWCERFRVVTAL